MEKWNDKMQNYTLDQIKFLFSRTIEDKFDSSMKPEYEQAIIEQEMLDKKNMKNYHEGTRLNQVSGTLDIEAELQGILNDLKSDPNSLINQGGRKYENQRFQNCAFTPGELAGNISSTTSSKINDK